MSVFTIVSKAGQAWASGLIALENLRMEDHLSPRQDQLGQRRETSYPKQNTNTIEATTHHTMFFQIHISNEPVFLLQLSTAVVKKDVRILS